ncbi:uncharacterized protein MYCFIDRAFT_174939 [Pseudocercospora fijiensis CIRAD86]|uniref:Uncharacterized protein n=1 Tax=Pseudocercospora fijiensis (strain CIRAD86) TaxID=383855 RepID=M3AFZ4_PSEFD|nr:uncharacterized protein MYCFIDRAFT_174939 [Pseudocercospora fijiensis CIRAD86]EME83511.1 hypothetical protein MYCFIDRAFT_174939 [Pseudocercospora fijiensis CIRAD86]
MFFRAKYLEYDFVWQLESRPNDSHGRIFGRETLVGTYMSYADIPNGQGIWGPHQDAYLYVKPQGPLSPARNATQWGVGESLDLITLAPIVDPVGPDCNHVSKTHGYDQHNTNFPAPTAIDISEAADGWVCLLHGLKAVYVPHQITFTPDADIYSVEEFDKLLHRGSPSNFGSESTLLPDFRWLKASYFYIAGKASKLWQEYTNGRTDPMADYPSFMETITRGLLASLRQWMLLRVDASTRPGPAVPVVLHDLISGEQNSLWPRY